MQTDELSISDSEATELPNGVTRRVYQYEWEPPKKLKPLNAVSGINSKSAQEEELRELHCSLAMERRETTALRKYVDWLTKRVQVLEAQLVEDKKC